MRQLVVKIPSFALVKGPDGWYTSADGCNEAPFDSPFDAVRNVTQHLIDVAIKQDAERVKYWAEVRKKVLKASTEGDPVEVTLITGKPSNPIDATTAWMEVSATRFRCWLFQRDEHEYVEFQRNELPRCKFEGAIPETSARGARLWKLVISTLPEELR